MRARIANRTELPSFPHMDDENPPILEEDPPQPIPVLHAQLINDVLGHRGPSPRPADREGRLGDERQLFKIDLHSEHAGILPTLIYIGWYKSNV